MIAERDGYLAVRVETPEELYQALDVLYNYAIEDLAGDPRHGDCLAVLSAAQDALAAAGVERKEWGSPDNE